MRWKIVLEGTDEFGSGHRSELTIDKDFERLLAGQDCIRVRLPSGAFVPWRLRMKRRNVEVHAERRLAVNDGRFAVRAAIEGVGLLQAPLEHVRADLAVGRLVTVLDEWAPPPLDGMFLYYPSRRQIRPALKALVDFFREVGRRPEAE